MDAPPLCLSEDIADRNDKPEPVPYLEESVRIIMRCPLLTKKMQARSCCVPQRFPKILQRTKLAKVFWLNW